MLFADSPVFATNTLTQLDEHDSLPMLSNLTDNELLLFLDNHKVEIPVGLAESQTEAMQIVRSTVVDIEQNPDVEFLYGLTQLYDFAYALKSVVNAYYGNAASSVLNPCASHGLRYSTVYQIPYNMKSYNCYAYALNRTSKCQPGQFSGHILTNAILKNLSIYRLAQYVKEDLQSTSLNKQCVKITSARPTYSSLLSGQTAICIRKGDDGNGQYDYHFMKLFSGNAWRHKPGETAILTYDYLPSNSRIWISEGYDGYQVITGRVEYYGSIYYILFKSSHSYLNSYTGYNYHSGTEHYYEYASVCSGCGDMLAGTATWIIISCSGSPCIDIVSFKEVY